MEKVRKASTDWKFMLPLIMGTMINPLNSTMLATALAAICDHFSENISAGSLLITPLYIATTIGQPLMGKLADTYDPKLVNRFGILIVIAGAIIGISAQAFSWLIVSRILFGLGSAAAYPSAMTLIAVKYGNGSRAIPGNVLGIITVASQVSMVLGPLLGGVLTESLGWQGVFLINVPWGLAALYFSKNILPVTREKTSNDVSLLKRLDVVGILLFAGFLILLLLSLIQREGGWPYIIACVASFVLFVFWELRQEHPFINVKLLLQKPSLLLVYVRTLGTNYILYLLLYALPQWIEVVKEISPSGTGLIMLPMSLMSALSAIVISSRIKKVSLLNLLGVISLALACGSLFLLHQQVAVLWVTGVTMLAGLAIGINIIANQSSLSVEAPPDQTGISFGLFRTFSALGAIVSGTQLKSLFHLGVTDDSIHTCGWYASISCVLVILLYLVRTKPKETAT